MATTPSAQRSTTLAALLVLLLALALAAPAAAQQRASVGGFVRDAETGETLILANVIAEGTSFGAATNTSGFYSLSGLPPGDYTLVASFIGYQPSRREVSLEAGEQLRLDFDLGPEGVLAGEVVVTADRSDEEEIRRIGVAQIETATIKQLPTVLQPDVFRSLQLLPGVKSASDFSSGLYVRGGSPDQTLILLDRTTVYNPSHVFGFFSTFNPDAIKDVRLYKGGYPAEYGGRLGSVLDIYNKDGNRNRYEGTLSLGLLSSRASVEGPYSRGSFMLAVRRSTLEPLLAVLQDQDIDGIPDSFYFYDINGKINFDAGQDDKLSLAVYTGVDDFQVAPFPEDPTTEFVVRYGNRTVSANWTHLFSQRLFSNFTATASRYFSDPDAVFAGTEFSRRNRVFDTSVKGDLEFIQSQVNSFSAGFWTGNFVMTLADTFDGEPSLSERIQTPYANAYVQHRYTPTPQWTLTYGLRGGYFAEGGYLRFEPRVSLEHRPVERVRLQAGYGRYYQYLTLITSELFSAFDVWLTTDEGVAPAFGDQFVAGVKTQVSPGGVDFNVDVEGYFRTMRELFELDPFLPDAAGVPYPDLFMVGEGYAFGTEVLIQKPSGRLNGFIGYTWGQTRRSFDIIEGGDFFAPKYDRTHDANIVLNYDLSRSWRATGVWTYGTGQAVTRPTAFYKTQDSPFQNGASTHFRGRFQQNRLPPYHRLDIGLSRFGRFFGFADYELQLQVINAYGRSNVWFELYQDDEEVDNVIEITEVPQIPIPLPNIAFTLEF
jgi:hypothetical protein